MAPLSIIASHRINGVSALHSELMVETIFSDYAKILPLLIRRDHRIPPRAPAATVAVTCQTPPAFP